MAEIVNRCQARMKHFNADAGDFFDQLALLFDGTAFHHFDMVGGHVQVSLLA